MSPTVILYLIDFLNGFNCFGAIIITAILILLIVLTIKWLADNDDRIEQPLTPMMKNLIKWFFILGALNILIPSEKTMYMMAGTHYLNKSEIPAKVEKIINDKLDDIIQKDKNGK